MAMINCPECGLPIDDSAKACPRCGRSFGPTALSIVGFILSFFIVFAPISFILCCVDFFIKNNRKKGLSLAGGIISGIIIALAIVAVIIIVSIYLLSALILVIIKTGSI